MVSFWIYLFYLPFLLQLLTAITHFASSPFFRRHLYLCNNERSRRVKLTEAP